MAKEYITSNPASVIAWVNKNNRFPYAQDVLMVNFDPDPVMTKIRDEGSLQPFFDWAKSSENSGIHQFLDNIKRCISQTAENGSIQIIGGTALRISGLNLPEITTAGGLGNHFFGFTRAELTTAYSGHELMRRMQGKDLDFKFTGEPFQVVIERFQSNLYIQNRSNSPRRFIIEGGVNNQYYNLAFLDRTDPESYHTNSGTSFDLAYADLKPDLSISQVVYPDGSRELHLVNADKILNDDSPRSILVAVRLATQSLFVDIDKKRILFNPDDKTLHYLYRSFLKALNEPHNHPKAHNQLLYLATMYGDFLPPLVRLAILEARRDSGKKNVTAPILLQLPKSVIQKPRVEFSSIQ